MSKRWVEKLGRKNRSFLFVHFARDSRLNGLAHQLFSFFFEKRVKNHLNVKNEKLTYFKKVEGGWFRVNTNLSLAPIWSSSWLFNLDQQNRKTFSPWLLWFHTRIAHTRVATIFHVHIRLHTLVLTISHVFSSRTISQLTHVTIAHVYRFHTLIVANARA